MRSKNDVRRSREMLIVKPNELSQKARNMLTSKQIDIVEYLLSLVQPTDLFDTAYYEFDIQEFCRIFGLCRDSGTHYAEIKKELQAIADVSCWIIDGKKERLFRWLNTVEINSGSGIIRVSFHDTVKKYIYAINPHNGYNEYMLSNIAALKGETGRNKYPKLLYMFLKSYEAQGNITVSLEDFCKIHCPTEYTEYRRINQRILKPSQEKINELTDINFYYEPYKAKGGKQTTHIMFKIYSKRLKTDEAQEALANKQSIAIDGHPYGELPF